MAIQVYSPQMLCLVYSEASIGLLEGFTPALQLMDLPIFILFPFVNRCKKKELRWIPNHAEGLTETRANHPANLPLACTYSFCPLLFSYNFMAFPIVQFFLPNIFTIRCFFPGVDGLKRYLASRRLTILMLYSAILVFFCVTFGQDMIHFCVASDLRRACLVLGLLCF